MMLSEGGNVGLWKSALVDGGISPGCAVGLCALPQMNCFLAACWGPVSFFTMGGAQKY